MNGQPPCRPKGHTWEMIGSGVTLALRCVECGALELPDEQTRALDDWLESEIAEAPKRP